MAPRSYDNSHRKATESATIARIVDATVDLHGQKGPLATSHAEIAALAGVSVATVYKHFPTRDSLLPHCIHSVEQSAPRLDMDAILSEPDVRKRIASLVVALFAQYAYYRPWRRFARADAPHLPSLAQAEARFCHDADQLVQVVLKSLQPGLSKEMLAVACVLLDYAAWQRLTESLNKQESVSSATEQVLHLLISTANRS